jgi:acetamidase/formamidase
VIHELPLGSTRLHGAFSRDRSPVLTVDPGDSVRLSLPNSGWRLGPDEEVERPDSAVDTGHALLGPIEVRGARAGLVLAVHVDEVTPGGWGETFDDAGERVHWELRDGLGHTGGRTVRLAPFLGVLGMPPAEPGIHSTRPPRPTGGNIDCKELVAGTTLFLPISVEGALFSAGDGHGAQGDGEVSGWAIECPVEARLTLDVRDDLELDWPIARTRDAWLTFGFDEDLGHAARIALDGMLDLMERERGIPRDESLVLASVAVDLRVTQIVNLAVGVHAVLRDDTLG